MRGSPWLACARPERASRAALCHEETAAAAAFADAFQRLRARLRSPAALVDAETAARARVALLAAQSGRLHERLFAICAEGALQREEARRRRRLERAWVLRILGCCVVALEGLGIALQRHEAAERRALVCAADASRRLLCDEFEWGLALVDVENGGQGVRRRKWIGVGGGLEAAARQRRLSRSSDLSSDAEREAVARVRAQAASAVASRDSGASRTGSRASSSVGVSREPSQGAERSPSGLSEGSRPESVSFAALCGPGALERERGAALQGEEGVARAFLQAEAERTWADVRQTVSLALLGLAVLARQRLVDAEGEGREGLVREWEVCGGELMGRAEVERQEGLARWKAAERKVRGLRHMRAQLRLQVAEQEQREAVQAGEEALREEHVARIAGALRNLADARTADARKVRGALRGVAYSWPMSTPLLMEGEARESPPPFSDPQIFVHGRQQTFRHTVNVKVG